MKKTLLATTFLVATAGFAAAEVTVGGSGRFGISSDSSGGGSSDSWLETRLTFNFDAKMESDSGITFGGRIRMRNDDGQSYTWGSPAMLYMEANGFRMEVGNANGAYDSAGLMWNSEVGLTDTSYGDPNNSYQGAFASKTSYSSDTAGVFASYSAGSFTVRASYHVDHQYGPPIHWSESSVSADYSANGLSLSVAMVQGSSSHTEDTTFVGAAYAIGDATNVGINYFTGDAPTLVTLYANHNLGNGLTIAGYIADEEFSANNYFGIGASYDLGGGAALKASYHDDGGYSYMDAGVTFSF